MILQRIPKCLTKIIKCIFWLNLCNSKRSCTKIKRVYTHCKGIWNVYCPMKNECRFENWIIFYLLIGFFQTFHIMWWWIYCPAQEVQAICFSFFKLHHILIYWVANQVISIENKNSMKKMNYKPIHFSNFVVCILY